MEAPLVPVEPLLKSALHIPHIAELIFSYFTFEELKSASLVNWNFCDAVRGTLRFQQNTVLILQEEAEGLYEMLLNTKCPWRNEVIVDLSLSSKSFRSLLSILHNFNRVTITSERQSNFWTYTGRIRHILRATPTLTLETLIVDVKSLEGLRTSGAGIVGALDIMENLVCLNILEPELFDGSYAAEWDSNLKKEPIAYLSASNCVFSDKHRNFQAFSTLKTDCLTPVLQELLQGVLQKFPESLEELRLDCEDAWNLEQLKTVFLHSIRILCFCVCAQQEDVVISFLQRHKTIEQLKVTVDGSLTSSLVDAIRTQSSKLTKLHIHSSSFSRVCNEDIWRFLKSMALLKDFRLFTADETSLPLDFVMISSLPHNQLESLQIAGSEGLVSNSPPLYSIRFPEAFKSLRCLRLYRCHSVDDTLVRGILRELTHLEEFELSFTSLLTSAGFSGEKDGEPTERVPFSNLRHLTSFTMSCCLNIPPEEILPAIAVPSLKSFQFVSDQFPIPDDLVFNLIRQNASLETLRLSLESSENAARLAELLPAQNLPTCRITHVNPVDV